MLSAWARDGLTDEQVAHNMGIAVSTLYDWKQKHPDISEALKKGKEVADIEVENALFKRATGYSYVEEIEERGEITKRTHKHMAPDVGACAIWLKNRRPDKWRDKQAGEENEIAANDGFLEALEESAGELKW